MYLPQKVCEIEMRKDYAKRVYSGTKKKPLNAKWFLLAAGLLAMIVVIFSHQQITAFFVQMKATLTKRPVAASSSLPKKQQPAAEVAMQFSFYNYKFSITFVFNNLRNWLRNFIKQSCSTLSQSTVKRRFYD